MFVQVDTDRWTWAISAKLVPLAAKLTSLMQPLLNAPAKWLKKHQPKAHSKIFEKQDLLDSLQQQNRQADNRLSQPEIDVVSGALSFGDKTVGSGMTPRKSVKLVAASDPIGPHLMDELHASGFSRLPVAKEVGRSATPEIVGTLYIKDLIDHPSKGRVRDVMKSEVYFVNEEQNLRQALGVFLTTQCHLLVVVNNFEEFVGVLSMEDVMEQILGTKIMDEFEQYSELRAVAAFDSKASEAEHSRSEMVE
jgi:CBS domain containing-hemolysin-like protein